MTAAEQERLAVLALTGVSEMAGASLPRDAVITVAVCSLISAYGSRHSPESRTVRIAIHNRASRR